MMKSFNLCFLILWGNVAFVFAADEKERLAIQLSVEKGIAFLEKTQNKDGSFGSPTLTKGINIYAPIPSGHHAFKTAVSALSLQALLEYELLTQKADDQKVSKARDWLLAHLERVKRGTPDTIYSIWTYAYSIQALLQLKQGKLEDRELIKEIDRLLEIQIQRLEKYESIKGGWGYYDFNAHTQKPDSYATSFSTAAILIALNDVRNAGFHVEKRLFDRGVKLLQRTRNSNGSFNYSYRHNRRPMGRTNRPGGSLGRSQAGILALRIFNDEKMTDEHIRTWLNKLFDRHGWLDIGRKRPYPHESWFSVAGYYFYFGHYYATLLIDELPKKERAYYYKKMAKILVDRQEKDGSWWDFPLYNYHKYYGSGFALMSLMRCAQGLDIDL